jgi:hypothetical protein
VGGTECVVDGFSIPISSTMMRMVAMSTASERSGKQQSDHINNSAKRRARTTSGISLMVDDDDDDGDGDPENTAGYSHMHRHGAGNGVRDPAYAEASSGQGTYNTLAGTQRSNVAATAVVPGEVPAYSVLQREMQPNQYMAAPDPTGNTYDLPDRSYRGTVYEEATGDRSDSSTTYASLARPRTLSLNAFVHPNEYTVMSSLFQPAQDTSNPSCEQATFGDVPNPLYDTADLAV